MSDHAARTLAGCWTVGGCPEDNRQDCGLGLVFVMGGRIEGGRRRPVAPGERVVRGRAQELRRCQTDAEGLLWQVLRRRGLAGYRFRRQQPIGPYIGDFVCMSERLVVELDGGHHAEKRERDLDRDAYLRRQGFRVLRFWNREVFEDCSAVADTIYLALSRGVRFGEGPPRGS